MLKPIRIGGRLELLIDDALIDEMKGASLELHNPVPCEVSLVTDRPWEGPSCGYITVFQDDDRFRMYYKTGKIDLKASTGKKEKPREAHLMSIAVAESHLCGGAWIELPLAKRDLYIFHV